MHIWRVVNDPNGDSQWSLLDRVGCGSMHGDIKTGAEYVRALDGYTRELRDPQLFDPNTFKRYYVNRNQVL